VKRAIAILLLLVGAGALAWGLVSRFAALGAGAPDASGRGPVPVAVVPVERGPIALRRTFSGALEAAAQFVVAPKVAGRVRELAVDLGDAVERGQVVARLDDEELVQAVRQAEADLAVS
jgi:multidrug efflux pump subunit AcrA (membrane-fusion protein)